MVSAMEVKVQALAVVIALCSWARHFIFKVPPSGTHVYKRVPVNLMLGVTLQWNSILSRVDRGSRLKYSKSLNARKKALHNLLFFPHPVRWQVKLNQTLGRFSKLKIYSTHAHIWYILILVSRL